VTLLKGLIKACRPKQWVKNVLVFAAPGAAGVYNNHKVIEHAVIAFIAFTIAASGTYLINDSLDVEEDRQHPKKKNRPIAAGIVPVKLGVTLGIVFMIAAPIFGGLLSRADLGWLIAGYVVMTLTYSSYLKHVPLIEMFIVAAGFLLRAIAGGAATNIPLSQWFLIVASFGSLFLVTGKRYAEVLEFGTDAKATRKVTSAYPIGFLRMMRDVSVAVTLLAYCIFAFERSLGIPGKPPWFQLSIAPVALGLLQYSLLLEQGQGGAPEEVLTRDRMIQIYGLIWVALFGLGVIAS
jgi:decaprenyl-phosphate phosphoribosyltransferase